VEKMLYLANYFYCKCHRYMLKCAYGGTVLKHLSFFYVKFPI
jgi:hypothetical protein